jgi:spermidine synthase
MSPNLTRLGVILFLSGFCSLVYQVAWLRLLRLIFGSSTASTAMVLAIFMGGLGLGGVLFGKRVERTANPLRLYGRLEVGIALSAALSPWFIDLVRSLYFQLGGVGSLGLAGATMLRLVFAVLVLGIPTTLMGGTLPAVAKALEHDGDHSRRIVATLYGVNAAGAVVGAFLSTFQLLELLGVRQTLYLACALNLLLAVIVRSMARAEGAPSPSCDSDSLGEPVSLLAEAPVGEGRARGRLLLAAAFVVGFVFFLMELVWYRMLGPILGGSSYTFGLILVVALLGISLGGLLYSFGSPSRRPTLNSLAWTCVLEGFFLALPYAFGDTVAFLAAVLRQLSALGFGGLVLGWTGVVCLVVLPAAIVSGYQFPLLVGLLGSGREKVGSQVGLVYAWNTWGAVGGALAGGFGLLPLLGAPRLWRLSALFLVLLGLAVAALANLGSRRWQRLAAPFAVALMTLMCCQAMGPSAFWRHSPIGAGRFKADFQGANELRRSQHFKRQSLMREGEGQESSVALMIDTDLALFVNGKSDGSSLGDSPTTVMAGLVGSLLHREPKQALVIGLGTGASAGWLAHVGSIDRVDVLELEPIVGEFAEIFAPVNLDVLENPKINLIYGDGREYVLTTPERYDVIFSEPSNPYRAGVADFFSKDFYSGLLDRLKPGGILVQWVQGYEVDAELLRLVYATISSVFPSVETWQVHQSDLLLVATREGLVHDYDRVRHRLEQEPYATALPAVWKVRGVEGFYSAFVGSPALSKHLAALHGDGISTDDRPLIEFGFAKNVGRVGLFSVYQLHDLARRLGAAQVSSSTGVAIDWELVREAQEVRSLAGTFSIRSEPGKTPESQARQRARVAWSKSDFAAVKRSGFLEERNIHHPMDEFIAVNSLIGLDDERVPAALQKLGDRFPAEAAFLAAHHSEEQGDPVSAAKFLVEAFGHLRTNPWTFLPIVHRGLSSVDRVAAGGTAETAELLYEALAEPFPVMVFEHLRRGMRVNLLQSVDFARHCESAFVPFEPFPVWGEQDLRLRLRCYSETGHPLMETARGELNLYYSNAPPTELDPSLPKLVLTP